MPGSTATTRPVWVPFPSLRVHQAGTPPARHLTRGMLFARDVASAGNRAFQAPITAEGRLGPARHVDDQGALDSQQVVQVWLQDSLRLVYFDADPALSSAALFADLLGAAPDAQVTLPGRAPAPRRPSRGRPPPAAAGEAGGAISAVRAYLVGSAGGLRTPALSGPPAAIPRNTRIYLRPNPRGGGPFALHRATLPASGEPLFERATGPDGAWERIAALPVLAGVPCGAFWLSSDEPLSLEDAARFAADPTWVPSAADAAAGRIVARPGGPSPRLPLDPRRTPRWEASTAGREELVSAYTAYIGLRDLVDGRRGEELFTQVSRQRAIAAAALQVEQYLAFEGRPEEDQGDEGFANYGARSRAAAEGPAPGGYRRALLDARAALPALADRYRSKEENLIAALGAARFHEQLRAQAARDSWHLIWAFDLLAAAAQLLSLSDRGRQLVQAMLQAAGAAPAPPGPWPQTMAALTALGRGYLGRADEAAARLAAAGAQAAPARGAGASASSEGAGGAAREGGSDETSEPPEVVERAHQVAEQAETIGTALELAASLAGLAHGCALSGRLDALQRLLEPSGLVSLFDSRTLQYGTLRVGADGSVALDGVGGFAGFRLDDRSRASLRQGQAVSLSQPLRAVQVELSVPNRALIDRLERTNLSAERTEALHQVFERSHAALELLGTILWLAQVIGTLRGSDAGGTGAHRTRDSIEHLNLGIESIGQLGLVCEAAQHAATHFGPEAIAGSPALEVLELTARFLGVGAAALLLETSIFSLVTDVQAGADEGRLLRDLLQAGGAGAAAAAAVIGWLAVPGSLAAVAVAPILLGLSVVLMVTPAFGELAEWLALREQRPRGRVLQRLCHAVPWYTGRPRALALQGVVLQPRAGNAARFEVKLTAPYPYGNLADEEGEAWSEMTRGKHLGVLLRWRERDPRQQLENRISFGRGRPGPRGSVAHEPAVAALLPPQSPAEVLRASFFEAGQLADAPRVALGQVTIELPEALYPETQWTLDPARASWWDGSRDVARALSGPATQVARLGGPPRAVEVCAQAFLIEGALDTEAFDQLLWLILGLRESERVSMVGGSAPVRLTFALEAWGGRYRIEPLPVEAPARRA